MKFWLARGNITQEVKVFKVEPQRTIMAKSGKLFWTAEKGLREDHIVSFYSLEKFLPMLNVEPGKCMMVDMDSSGAISSDLIANVIISVIDSDVKCETMIR